MSDEWTPTLEDVRARYVTRYDALAFDRWLAPYAEQVRAAERERCAQIAEATTDIRVWEHWHLAIAAKIRAADDA